MTFARTIAIASMAVVLFASRAMAAIPYSAVRQGIESACNAPASTGPHAVYLARLDAADGTTGVWRRADPDAEHRAVAAAAFHGGEFATVREASSTLTALLVRRDANGAIGSSRNWCFIGGGLSRAGSEFVDGAKQIDWRRTQYFDPSLDVSQRDIVTWISMSGVARPPAPATPVEQLTIDPYKTPSELPFFEAYRAAVAGHLPALSKAL